MINEYIESEDEKNPVKLEAYKNEQNLFYMSIERIDEENYFIDPCITITKEDAKWLVKRLNDFIDSE